jgi:sulfate adenylyltransferase subunit 2
MSQYYLNYLDELESEAIFILREVWAQFENPVILFSGGKDSILVTHLAKKSILSCENSISFNACRYRA